MPSFICPSAWLALPMGAGLWGKTRARALSWGDASESNAFSRTPKDA